MQVQGISLTLIISLFLKLFCTHQEFKMVKQEKAINMGKLIMPMPMPILLIMNVNFRRS